MSRHFQSRTLHTHPPVLLRTANPHPMTPHHLFLPTPSSAVAQMGSASSGPCLVLVSVKGARDSNNLSGISPGGSREVRTRASQRHPGPCSGSTGCSAVWSLPAHSRGGISSLPKRALLDLLTECRFIKKGVSKSKSPKRGLLSTSYVLYGRSSGH